MKVERGDTIVEVLLAFAVFAAVAVSVTVMMNRSMATAQRSLEITQVRQQIDIQADLLRYVRDNDQAVWESITSNLSPNYGEITGGDPCPDHSGVESNSFALRMSDASGTGPLVVSKLPSTAASTFAPAGHISSVDHDAGKANGLWITPVYAEGSTSSSLVKAYDMYIRACWYTVGQDRPMMISTIVRLYES